MKSNDQELAEKISLLMETAISWQEIYESRLTAGKKVSIEQAKAEATRRYGDVQSVLLTFSNVELGVTAAMHIFELRKAEWKLSQLQNQFSLIKKQREIVRGYFRNTRTRASSNGKRAADILHSQEGGTRSKREAICAAWASGKYTSRDICAEQECAALDMSFSTARKALRGTPKPA